ncbi:hypothetical protein [Nonomuraea turkmeniaca]|nr:hypothetical protein [Nonomuraea turkmeniaca]
MLAEDRQDTCRALAAKEGDRFSAVTWESDDGALFLQGAVC